MLRRALDRRSFIAAATATLVGLPLSPARGQSDELAQLSLAEASERLRNRSLSSVELTRACLERIEKYNPRLNAFITVLAEQALVAAREADGLRQRRGALHGIPIAVKDNMDTAGVRTTAASELFKDRVPSEDAEVVRRLRNAGAIVIGKTNLHEFAYGGSSSISYFGPVRNPWALDRVPGGSSGGSAAAVAAHLAFGALGTDTAGSVRIPASYCGIVGLKPTYGRVSNRNVIPLSWTLDHIGPLCKTVEDTALLLQAVAGFDPLDPTSADTPVPDFHRTLSARVSDLRLGTPRTGFFEGLDPEIEQAVEGAIAVLRKLTAGVKDVQLPAAPNLRLIMGPEALAYHSRWIAESPQKYQAQTRERIPELGNGVTQQEYVQARRDCALLRREIRTVFASVDLLVTPTMSAPPSMIEPLERSASLDPGRTRNTWPFDVSGLPAISVPCGFTRSGLPIGLQIVGAPFEEATVLRLAHAYERETSWHTRRPMLQAA